MKPDLDQEDVARVMARYNLPSVAVVDDSGKLLGRVTFDDVIDVVEAEQTEDLLKFGGVSADEALAAGWTEAVRSRLPWLYVNLITAFLAGGVVYFFQDTMQRAVALAVYMPIIAGMGGNAGTQALAVTVRRLALGLIPPQIAYRVVGKEVLVGMTNGVAIGVVVGAIAAFAGRSTHAGRGRLSRDDRQSARRGIRRGLHTHPARALGHRPRDRLLHLRHHLHRLFRLLPAPGPGGLAPALSTSAFVPKLVTTLRTYTRAQFSADVVAGIIVGIVALPLAIAFAIASGLTPDRGLYTAVIAGFLISALGGSRVQIGGPTGAFVVIVYGIVQQYGVDGLLAATLMAGVVLIAFGLAGLGGAIKFIPFPVVTGFTAAIGAIILVQQLRDALGLRMERAPAEVVDRVIAYVDHIGSVNPHAVAVSLLTLLILLVWPRVSRRLPAPFVALIATTVAVQALGLPVETIGSRFGEISAALPRPVLPSLGLGELRELVGPAFTIAALGAIESLLSAVVADGMIGGRHRSNMELVAQGVANIASPLFGGMPATGAIARTATNIKSGGRTPVAGIVHALTLLLITLFFGHWAGLHPAGDARGHRVGRRLPAERVARLPAASCARPKSDALVMVITFRSPCWWTSRSGSAWGWCWPRSCS